MLHPDSRSLPANGLLASLSRIDRDYVTGACEPTELTLGDEICQPGDRIQHVYFPTDSYISLIKPSGDSDSLEVGMIGSEGMFGATLLLDVKVSALLALVQGDGPALRMSAARFRRIANERTSVKKTLNRYLFVLSAQLAQTAACNRFHHLDARLAQWLLMTQDRAHNDTFKLTQNFLAYMLGVRRAGVSEAASRLQVKGQIQYGHGELTVVNRSALEAASCVCYAAARATYLQHLGTEMH